MYNPNEPRDAEGKWTDAGNAIRNAASDKVKNLSKLRAEYESKSVEELIKIKKKLYKNMDIEAPMSEEEKLLNEVIAKKFSDINEQIRLRRNARLQ